MQSVRAANSKLAGRRVSDSRGVKLQSAGIETGNQALRQPAIGRLRSQQLDGNVFPDLGRFEELSVPTVGQIERKTQQRVVKLFREQLGYAYLGDWTEWETKTSVSFQTEAL